MNSLPLYNRSAFSQLSGLRGQSFGGQGRLKVNIRSVAQTAATSPTRDTASISAAASALQGGASASPAQSSDRAEFRTQDLAKRQERGENLRSRLLERARAGGIGVEAVSNAMSRLDARFELDSTEFVEQYALEFQTNDSPKPVAVETSAKPDRMTMMQGKLKKSAAEFDMRAKESGVSQERVADLKRMLHERARAAYTQGE